MSSWSAMVWAFAFSPDGEYARVTTLDKPFSYIVPVSSFGKTEEIWDRTGRKLLEFNKTEISTGLRGNVPDAPGVGGSGNDSGKRQVAWRWDGEGLSTRVAVNISALQFREVGFKVWHQRLVRHANRHVRRANRVLDFRNLHDDAMALGGW